MVALEHGRDFVGIDLQVDYLDMARARLMEGLAARRGSTG